MPKFHVGFEVFTYVSATGLNVSIMFDGIVTEAGLDWAEWLLEMSKASTV